MDARPEGERHRALPHSRIFLGKREEEMAGSIETEQNQLLTADFVLL